MAKSLHLKKSEQCRSGADTEREQIGQFENETLELGPSERRNTSKIGFRGAESTRHKLKRLADGFRKSLEQSDLREVPTADISAPSDASEDKPYSSSQRNGVYQEPLSGVSHSTVGLKEIPAATRIAIDRIVGPASWLKVTFIGDDRSRIYQSVSKKSGEVELEWTEPVFLKLVKGVREDVLVDMQAEKVLLY